MGKHIPLPRPPIVILPRNPLSQQPCWDHRLFFLLLTAQSGTMFMSSTLTTYQPTIVKTCPISRLTQTGLHFRACQPLAWIAHTPFLHLGATSRLVVRKPFPPSRQPDSVFQVVFLDRLTRSTSASRTSPLFRLARRVVRWFIAWRYGNFRAPPFLALGRHVGAKQHSNLLA